MSDEPELRRDPVTGRWVVIAPERARRPIAFSDHAPRHRTSGENRPCPFCAGAEAETPHEVYAIRDPNSTPNAAGWQLRVVPNMYPAVRPNATATASVNSPGPMSGMLRGASDEGGEGQRPPRGAPDEFPLFNVAPAAGFAEVLIDCPDHIDDPTKLTDDQFADVFIAYRERMIALSADPRLAHVSVFKNVGAEAGASLAHTHSQIIATPIVPELLRTELTGAEVYTARYSRCVFCDLIEKDLAERSRVVARSAHFVALTAFAPRFAYEMWVLPIAHEARYESLSDTAATELAILLKQVLRALDQVQNAPAYNWFVHTTPLHAGEPAHYHWHLEILPRTARPAGLEWGYGCHITTVAPEHAATQLRSALTDVATM